jgi:HEAT repeat protein
MSTILALLLSLGMIDPAADPAPAAAQDLASLREMLHDQQRPRRQSQAALLLIQNPSPDAQEIIHQGLRQTDTPEVFHALASALRVTQDHRFNEDLLSVLNGGQPLLRTAAAESLAELADPKTILRLQALLEDAKVERPVRQAATRALGRSASRLALVVLLDQIENPDEVLRQAVLEALAELTGQEYGSDVRRWRAWWTARKNFSDEHWLEERLSYQQSRSRRLEGDLERTKAEVVRLHQELYAHLPAGDRLRHVQGLADAEDHAVRVLAITWSTELLTSADAIGQRALADLLLRFSHDGNAEVQRSAVLALGNLKDSRAFDRLRSAVQHGPAHLRAAAARALGQQASLSSPDILAQKHHVVAILQKSLEDHSLEVVVEAAESLGSLGVAEAGPVLMVLLRHPSPSVRQTAALALERVADLTSLDGLLEALDDPGVSIRFSLVGALGHAVGDGHALREPHRNRLLARLEALLLRDPDPGVRSRAATVLGECGPPTVLLTLWGRIRAPEDARVQEKAWAALVEILVRAGNLELLQEWDQKLSDAKQGPRRLLLLADAVEHWQKKEETKTFCGVVLETLVQAQLDQGKWAAALPGIRELLARPAADLDVERRLHWLLEAGEQALTEGNRAEALHVVQEAQPFLLRRTSLAADFGRLEKQAR